MIHGERIEDWHIGRGKGGIPIRSTFSALMDFFFFFFFGEQQKVVLKRKKRRASGRDPHHQGKGREGWFPFFFFFFLYFFLSTCLSERGVHWALTSSSSSSSSPNGAGSGEALGFFFLPYERMGLFSLSSLIVGLFPVQAKEGDGEAFFFFFFF